MSRKALQIISFRQNSTKAVCFHYFCTMLGYVIMFSKRRLYIIMQLPQDRWKRNSYTNDLFITTNFRFPKQELLVYKCFSLENTLQSSSNVDFQLVWRRSFAHPLFAIEYLDLTNDGLKEIAVASLSGLHVLQVGAYCFVFPVKTVEICSSSQCLSVFFLFL